MPAWLDKLNEQQSLYANKIADKAQEMGVPPQLALALAYHESGFDPRKIGSAKEIGLMQVLPSTGAALGYSPKDLADPDKNIEAGLKYLKQHLEAYGGAQELAALAYNRGPGVASKFIAGEEDPAGQAYVKAVGTLGGFSGQPAEKEAAEPAAPEEPTPEQKATMAQQRQERNEEMERLGAAGLGGGAGAAYSVAAEGIPLVKGAAAKTLQALMSAAATPAQQAGAQVAQQAGQVTGAVPAGVPAVPSTPDVKVTGPGSGNVNYGIRFGLTPGEAAEAADMTKEEGGVWDIKKKKKLAEQKIERIAPGQFVQDFETSLYVPRDLKAEAQQAQAEWEQLQAAKQAAQLAAAQQAAAAAQAARPVPPLQQVTQTFQRMMASPAAQTAARIAGRGLSVLGLAGAGYEGMGAVQELQRPEPNYPLAAATGLSALGGALSAFPLTQAVGIPMAMAGQFFKSPLEKMREQAISSEDYRKMIASQPRPKSIDMAKTIRPMGATISSPF